MGASVKLIADCVSQYDCILFAIWLPPINLSVSSLFTVFMYCFTTKYLRSQAWLKNRRARHAWQLQRLTLERLFQHMQLVVALRVFRTISRNLANRMQDCGVIASAK